MYTIKYLFYSNIFIKLIIVGLIAMLILIVTMGITKMKRISCINSYIKEFEKIFWSGINLEDFYEANKNNLNHPLGMIFKAVFEEWKVNEKIRSIPSAKADVKQRLLEVAYAQKIKIMQSCETYMDILSVFIHITPFLGLLGTVIGLIDVFYNIDIEKGITIYKVAISIGGSLVCLVFSMIVTIASISVFYFFNTKLQLIENKIDNFIADFLHVLGYCLDGAVANTLQESSNNYDNNVVQDQINNQANMQQNSSQISNNEQQNERNDDSAENDSNYNDDDDV